MLHIRRLGIVNRAEPAVRALTAVRELNRAGGPSMTSVVLYTEPDAHAWYVREADEAVPLGPATFVDPVDGRRKSRYLDEAAVVDALREAAVDAVWVGWGFVAEHASFARRCEAAGMLFVGPDSDTMELLGDKIEAKRLAERAGVPTVPWSGGPVGDDAAEHAARLGYPVLLKAVAGGGGRGIRVVHRPEQLAPALASARAEAELAFGDARVFIERLMPAARHVEVQVIADSYGKTWAVGVRDCSVQRRHQKVIEESGSTVLDEAAERALRQAAVRLAATAGYRNAGTVEFLVDPDTRRFYFMEVNARLQVEHPVTELTTGLDLVKLQLQVACGGRLTGRPPEPVGHAIEARLCAEDPEQGFAPAPGRLAVFAPATGPGVRLDAGVCEGDQIAADFDSMIAKIIAWGRDRDEALARLGRALRQTAVVVAGGASNRSFLLGLLDRPEVRTGRYDNQWLDRLTADGDHLPAPDPVALLVAAVEAYEADQAVERANFHARAARGRPDTPTEVGHGCLLRYRACRYPLRTYRVGAGAYRIHTASTVADVAVERIDEYRRRVVVGGRAYRVLVAVEGGTVRVDVDGAMHTVTRDDGGVVRAGWPAFVVSARVAPGDVVAEGDALLVLESMKMETTLTAPYGGEVTELLAAPNTQVEAGTPLLRIRASAIATERPAEALRLGGLTAPRQPGTPTCERVYGALHGYLLGYDLDAVSVRRTLVRQRRLGWLAPPADPGLLRCEDALLDLFAEVGALYRPRTGIDGQPDADPGGSPREYLLSYLQWLDPDRAGLPPQYRERLAAALRRYGVSTLDRTPELADAVVWMFRSFRRLAELVPVVTDILQRRLRHREVLAPAGDGQLRARLDRLAAAAEGRHQVIADLARDVRYHYLDAPLLARVVAQEYARAAVHLDALRTEPDGPDRDRHIDRLVACPQPLRGELLRRWLTGERAPVEAATERRALLEVYTRRYYRIRPLHELRVIEPDGRLLCTAQYARDGRQVHLVTGYAHLDELPKAAVAVAAHLASVPAGRAVVVDLATACGTPLDGDALAARVRQLVAGSDFGRPLHRLDITVTTVGRSPEHVRTGHFTFRAAESSYVEQPLYRNLHPMLGKRLELWRLSNFRLERLRSAEDVYLFHGVAHDNPADHRLFALAEIRDLTPVRDATGAVSYPRLELMALSALAGIREAVAGFAERERPTLNRIVLYVRPLWTVPPEAWTDLAHSLAPLAAGAGLDQVILRVRIPSPPTADAGEPSGGGARDAVLHVEGLGRSGVTVRERPPGREPVRPLSPYQQKVLRARRFGAPYPYELIRLLTPPPGAVSRFPTGWFTEHDLDDANALVPVDRAPGSNTSNIVVGLISNRTAKVPEGMTRVALLGDPTRGLGNLAEGECRRIIAGLDLAERMRVPVEWFALSSGARIAMDSGTENMDWIAAVLRRLIEFTQAGGEVNVVVTGISVGAQPYWNAEATMLMHTRGILIMTPDSVMVLTGKQALDFSGGVSAEDNFGIGGFDRIMGPNGQGQYWAANLEDACALLLRHYEHTYVVPGERYPRRIATADPRDRDVRTSPHTPVGGTDLVTVGDVFSAERNPDRKKPFDIRSVMRAVADVDTDPLERWRQWRSAETAVVWDAHIGGMPVCLLGFESQTAARRGFVPVDGPPNWTSGTLFPQSSRKIARAVNAASGNRPVVVLANLSGFDGSPESMRRWQLEYGAEIGRAVTNFRGPIVFVVVSRYHGGAFVVFSKTLNDRMQVAAIEGSFASVIGGAPAAATVFAREVAARTERDPRLVRARERLANARDGAAAGLRTELAEVAAAVRAERLGEVADEFDAVHSVQRALAVGSIDRIIEAAQLRPYVIDALERALATDPCPSSR